MNTVIANADGGAAPDPESIMAERADFCRSFPAWIKTVAIVSPASRPDPAGILEVMECMRRHGIRVKPGKYIFEQASPNASGATLEQRKTDFMAAWMDPETDLVMCTRGGSGAQDLVKVLDWELMKKRPGLPFIGYSNITILTSAMRARKTGHPFAGPNLRGLYCATEKAVQSFNLAIAGKTQGPYVLTPLRRGDCSGSTYAGHLVMLNWIDQEPEFRVDPTGCIVFVECVRRPVEELSRHWSELVKRGFFREVRGVVFCHFSRIGTPEEVQNMLESFARSVSCPVYCGFPYGHEADNHSLDLLGHAEIKDGKLMLFPKLDNL